jgi:DNA end-binding protein Ku
VLEMVTSKVEGKEITAAAPEAQRAQVIDLMDALKQSLAKRGGGERPTAAGAPVSKKPPAKAPKRAAASDKDRKAQAGRK